MATARERKCCREFSTAVTLQPAGCITDHGDFAGVCLNEVVLRLLYWDLRDQGARVERAEHKYTYTFIYRAYTDGNKSYILTGFKSF